MSSDAKRPAAEVRPIAEALVALLRPHTEWIDIAGSLRRGAKQVGDIEVVAIPLPSFYEFTDAMIDQGDAAKARYGAKQMTRWGKKLRGLIFRDVKCELYLVDHDNRGFLYWLRTGPDNAQDRANTFVVTKIKYGHAPFRIEGGYVWIGQEKLRVETERDWFDLLGIPYLEPGERSVKTYTRLFAKGHRGGDVNRFRVQQQRLFSFQDTREVELSTGDPGIGSKKKQTKPFDWEAPWLLPDGSVWLYTGYGQFAAASIEDKRVLAHLEWLRQYPSLRESEQRRLQSWLDFRALDRRWHALAGVMSEIVDIFSEHLYAV